MTTISVTAENIDQVLRALSGTEKQIDRARKRAIRKTAQGIRTDMIRALAKEHDMPTKAFKPGKGNNSRYRGRVAKNIKNINKAYVWVGHDPIKSGYIGRLRNAKRKGGAFARRYFFQGGFIAKMNSGHQGIFERDPVKKMRTKDKAAIFETEVALINTDAIARRVSSSRGEFFEKTLRQELNYEINHAR